MSSEGHRLEDERVARDVNTVLKVARSVHPGRAFRFLGRENAAFDGATPLWMIKQGKTVLVLELLQRSSGNQP